MHCPKCAVDINDFSPECPKCGFHIRELDAVFGIPPERSDLITDLAKVFSDSGKKKIRERLQSFTERTTHAFFVIAKESTEPRLPGEFVFWLFERWNIGGESHAGLLILLSIKERRIEVEVGYDLERFISDEGAANILQFHAVPFLKHGDYDGGMYHAVDLLARIIEDEERREKSE